MGLPKFCRKEGGLHEFGTDRGWGDAKIPKSLPHDSLGNKSSVSNSFQEHGRGETDPICGSRALSGRRVRGLGEVRLPVGLQRGRVRVVLSLNKSDEDDYNKVLQESNNAVSAPHFVHHQYRPENLLDFEMISSGQIHPSCQTTKIPL